MVKSTKSSICENIWMEKYNTTGERGYVEM